MGGCMMHMLSYQIHWPTDGSLNDKNFFAKKISSSIEETQCLEKLQATLSLSDDSFLKISEMNLYSPYILILLSFCLVVVIVETRFGYQKNIEA